MLNKTKNVLLLHSYTKKHIEIIEKKKIKIWKNLIFLYWNWISTQMHA